MNVWMTTWYLAFGDKSGVIDQNNFFLSSRPTVFGSVDGKKCNMSLINHLQLWATAFILFYCLFEIWSYRIFCRIPHFLITLYQIEIPGVCSIVSSRSPEIWVSRIDINDLWQWLQTNLIHYQAPRLNFILVWKLLLFQFISSTKNWWNLTWKKF